MRRNSIFNIILLCSVLICFEHLQAQTLQVSLSPDYSKVDRNAREGTATIFFDSSIEDLSIVCTEEDPNEPITKINDHLWYVHIDVKKDIEMDDICYRNYLLKSSSSAEYYLTTDPITSKQVLYYTVTLPNELEPKLLEEKSRNLAAKAMDVANGGDSYLAQKIALQALDYAYTIEAEAALRYSCFFTSAVLRDIPDYTQSIDFSPDANYMISTALWDTCYIVWDLSTGMKTVIDDYYHMYLNELSYGCYSPDGKYILIARDKVRVYDANSFDLLDVLDVGSPIIRYAVYSPDGERIFVVTEENILVFNASNYSLLYSLNVRVQGLTPQPFSPDGSRLCCYEEHNGVFIIDARTGKKLKSFKIKDLEAWSYCPERELIATWTSDGIIRLWDALSGRLSQEINDFSEKEPGIIALNPDGESLAVSYRNTISLFDTESGTKLRDFIGPASHMVLAFSRGGRFLASISGDQTIRIWDLDGDICTVSKVTPPYASDIKKVIQSSDGKKEAIVYDSRNKPITIFDKITGDTVFQMPVDIHDVHAITFSPDNKFFISSSSDTTYIWDTEDGKELKRFTHESSATCVAFSPDGKHVATGCLDGFWIWNLQTGNTEKSIKPLHKIQRIESLAYSPNGKYIAVHLWDRVQVYDTQKWLLLLDFNTLHSTSLNDFVEFENDCISLFLFLSKNEIYKLTWEFPSLDTLIDQTREQFKNCPITQKEKAEYNIEL